MPRTYVKSHETGHRDKVRRTFPVALAAAAAAIMTVGHGAQASEFSPEGEFSFSPDAVSSLSFETEAEQSSALVQGTFLSIKKTDQALDGTFVGQLDPKNSWDKIRLTLKLPASQSSYRVRMWTRRGALLPAWINQYDGHLLSTTVTDFSPTGRCTSDGWVEIQTAPVSVDGPKLTKSYLSIRGNGQLDAIEVVPDGDFKPEMTCVGLHDESCGTDGVCIDGVCRDGNQLVPALPSEAERDRVVTFLSNRLSFFFGGFRSRRDHLPDALAQVELMRSATSAWTFWNRFTAATRYLRDWHTHASGLLNNVSVFHKLNVCFIEGDADLSHDAWPKHPRYQDIMVAYTGQKDTAGLHAGDRLIAVDGVHPITWARSTIDRSWDWWQADDDTVNVEFIERLRGLIVKYAKTITVLPCDESTDTCSSQPRVIEVADLPKRDGSANDRLIACDNRPAYHLQKGPSASNHEVGYNLFYGPIKDGVPGENIYGLTWDSLWGPAFTSEFKKINKIFKDKSRGVILDHRAGNGGTIDAPEALTELVRDPLDIAIFIFERPTAHYEGPSSQEQGLAIFNRYKNVHQPDLTYTVGSHIADKQLPVALLIHRDGSASDYLPFGMKGAPHVRIFGPHPTAGAFSSFTQMKFWGWFQVQMARGDTISYEGAPLIGAGVRPDEVVQQKQSDLLHGRDTIYRRALQWVRSELKP